MSLKHIELALFIARDGSRLPRSVGLEIESLSYHDRDRRSRLILGRIAPDTHGQGTPWPDLLNGPLPYPLALANAPWS